MTMVVSPEVKSNFREDTLPQKPELTTADVIKVGEDISSVRSYEELFHDGMLSELSQLDAAISFKVKNELVTQIFSSLKGNQRLNGGGFQFNIASVVEIVQKELQAEKNRHFQSASVLENVTIPLARTRTEKNFDIPHYYTIHDLDNLQARSDIHTEVSDRLMVMEATGDEVIFNFAEKHIQRMSVDARDAALEIVTQQKLELEIRNLENEAKIGELQDTVSLLQTRVEMAHEQADVRTVPLPDREETLRLLTQDALSFAA